MCPYINGYHCERNGKKLSKMRVSSLCETGSYYECVLLNEDDHNDEEERHSSSCSDEEETF